MIITDGKGTGYQAQVNTKGQLETCSVTLVQSSQASNDGDSYNINTGVMTLTSGNKSAVLYMKNNETKPILIDALFYLIGNSTGGVGDMLITVLRNPTAGTVVSDATDAEMAGVNRNFGSSKTLDADIYKGGEGKTLTDGDKVIESIFNQVPTRAVISAGAIVLPKGSSIGIEVTPATLNTSLDVEFAISCYLES